MWTVNTLEKSRVMSIRCSLSERQHAAHYLLLFSLNGHFLRDLETMLQSQARLQLGLV